MAIEVLLSPADINALAHNIDTEAAQLRRNGKEGGERWHQIEQQLADLRKKCPHETKHKNFCVDCGARC